MKGKILLSGMLAGIICSMVFASDMDLIQNNPGLKCIRESGAPVTAMTMYYDDRCAICGDMDGNIYRINSDGYEKLKSTGLGRIDSIVLGKVPEGIACFTVQGGSLYEHNKGNIINVSGAWGEKVKGVYKGKYGKKIYAATENGNVYIMSNDGAWKEVSKDAVKKIIKNFTSESDRVLSDSNGNIACLSSNGSVKFAYSKDGKIYAEDPYEPKPMSVKVSYVSGAVGYPERAIYRVEIEGRRLTTDDIFIKGYNGFRYTLYSFFYDTTYGQVAYPILGAIYDSNGKDNATLQARKISFLWLGPKLEKTKKANLVVKEWAYDFSKNSEISLIDSEVIALPEASEIPDYSLYRVEVLPAEDDDHVVTYPNGVCVKPLNVKITDNDGNYIDPELDDVYDHLVFYVTYGSENKHAYKNGLIGCDPSESTSMDSGYIAIVPDSCAEIDGYIKYGSTRNWKQIEGRRFYAYYNNDSGSANIIVGLIPKDGDIDNTQPVQNFDISAEQHSDMQISTSNNMNNPSGRTFSFSPETYGSNWKGNKDYYRIGAGYLDYQLTWLTKEKKDTSQGVFVYLPEGYNTRPPQSRKDLRSASLTVGYYLDPVTVSNDPMLAEKYKITDTTSYCEKMRGKPLYAMLFDQCGRCALKQNETDPDKAMTYDGKNNLWDLREKGDSKSELHTEIIVRNTYNVPIVVNSKLDSFPDFADKGTKDSIKYGITETGIFLPPYYGSNEFRFMTEQEERKKTKEYFYNYFGVSGHLFNNDEGKILFANYFETYMPIFINNGILLYAQLSKEELPEGDKTWWQTPEKDFNPAFVRSYISTYMMSNSGLMDLYITYARKDKIVKEINLHNLISNRGEYTGLHSAVSAKGALGENDRWRGIVKQSLPGKE